MDLKELKFLLGDMESKDLLPLFNNIKVALNSRKEIVTNDFYSPNIYTVLIGFFKTQGIKIEANGGFLEAEKRLIAFNVESNIYWPYSIIKITTSKNFNNLVHKDYLGAVLGIGIERSKIGDLRVKENICYLPVTNEIVDYILYNLKSIGKLKCSCEEIFDLCEIPKVEFDEKIILTSALRLDSLVSALTNKSRNDSLKLITSGLVSVNYKVIREKSFNVKSDYRITIRGYGKFIIGNVIGETKNSRLKIEIKKFT